MSNTKLVIVPYIKGAYFFYNVIDLSLYLCVNESYKYKNFNVNIIFYRMPFWVSKVNFRNISSFLQKKIGIKKNIPYKNFTESISLNSLYGKFVSGQEVTLTTSIGQINLTVKEGCTSPIAWLKAFYFGIRNYSALKVNNSFGASKLMALKFSGIEIGTSVGSAALRNDYMAHGSIKHCNNLFFSLIGAVYFISFLKKQLSNFKIKDLYVIPSERYFLHSLFVRTTRYLGGNILDGLGYKYEKKLISSDLSYEYFDVVNNDIIRPLSDSERVNSIKHLEGRLNRPSNSLWYMFRGANIPHLNLRNTDGKSITTEEKELYVVVFLHQFEDGQYCFGYDGFNDIYEWTVFTIDTLIKNPNIKKIFIKSHPNASSAKYPGDEIAIKNIINKYRDIIRVEWLDSSCGPLSLKNPGIFIGVTKHGSIAEELSSIDISNISSICSRWADNYKFSKIWRSKDDYQNILLSISHEKNNLFSFGYKDDLYRYIRDYRLQAKNIHERQAWFKFAFILNAIRPTPIDFEIYNNLLSNLNENSIEFNNFIKYLIEYNKNIVDNNL